MRRSTPRCSFSRTPTLSVIDLRSNQGGSPETLAHLAAYLFDQPGKLPGSSRVSGPTVPLFNAVADGGNRERQAASFFPPVGTHFLRRRGGWPSFSRRNDGPAPWVSQRRVPQIPAGLTPPDPICEVRVPNGQVRDRASGGDWEGSIESRTSVRGQRARRPLHFELAKRALSSNVQAPR